MYSIYWGLSPYGKKKVENYSLFISLGVHGILNQIDMNVDHFANNGWLEFHEKFNGSQEMTEARIGSMHEKMDKKNWEECIGWLEKIFAFCNDHDIRLILFAPPYSEELNNQIAEFPYQEKIDKFLADISSSSNLEFYDFNNNKVYVDSLFSDADHLNANGAKLLTDAFKEILSNPLSLN